MKMLILLFLLIPFLTIAQISNEPQGPVSSAPDTIKQSEANKGTIDNLHSVDELTVKVVYTFVEQPPKFPGGQKGIAKYLKENLIYPEKEKINKISGIVYLSFIIDKDGRPKEIKELRGVKGGDGLTKEAIRLVENMPNWEPGKMHGKIVDVEMSQQIKFEL